MDYNEDEDSKFIMLVMFDFSLIDAPTSALLQTQTGCVGLTLL